MPVIKILPHPEYAPEGKSIEAPSGTTICEAMLDNHIDIEHACDQVCACTTCHVIVREGFASLSEMEENEEDMLDRAWGLEPNSRLSCQAILSNKDVTVEIPKYSINHAKENH
ncbi:MULTISPECIES: ISC system 2Fe-2S type ferredoxin [unclassified Roseateles]|jgi:ferredoxin, 2Fe-2S|uniref:ISC system 2Fe-2S type ferredoxin n=1 Tax=Roseateles TaxID=93681 RepID=UPI0002E75175|nr:ISC system 2Fe-2S type ferredoxin [Mitsuaria sp. 7]ANH67847.1 2Fe-2S ferredoxin [Mitsuaria sp. 7]OWQ45544.1 ISC system 2Fe-2S type ferredoxin [Roseateles noduli]RZI57726.1 MAG: ISC system 2Fe-2S type ferredoxin [Rubrivivax sp.]